MQKSVYLCYQREDVGFCHKLAKALRDDGFDVWYDPENAEWGKLGAKVQQEIEERALFIVLLTPKALHSRWIEDQCRWAFHHLHQPDSAVQAIVPVLITKLGREAVWPILADFRPIATKTNQPYRVDEAISQTLRLAQAISQGTAVSNTRVSGDQQQESAAFLAMAGEATRPKNRRRSGSQGHAKSPSSHPRIYVCFQPQEALQAAGLAAHWQHELHEPAIMLDQSRLVATDRFRAEVLEGVIGHCKLFLVLLTKEALEAANDPRDLFHQEVAYALQQPQILVVPVLLDGFVLPPIHELPMDLQHLADPALRDRYMHLRDVYDEAIQSLVGRATKITKPAAVNLFKNAASTLIITLLLAGLGYLVTKIWNRVTPQPSPTPPNMLIVSSEATTVNALAPQPAMAKATCPTNSTLVSGGYRITDPTQPVGDYFPQASYPSTDGTSWNVSYLNDSNDQQSINAVAYCLQNVTVTTQVVAKTNPTAPNSFTAPCPANMIATGGGYQFQDTSTIAITSAPTTLASASDTSAAGWVIASSGTNNATLPQTAYAICAASSKLTISASTPKAYLIAPSKNAPIQVQCASGLLVGGAYMMKNEEGVQNDFIIQNTPMGASWQLIIANFDGINQSGMVWPLCATFH